MTKTLETRDEIALPLTGEDLWNLRNEATYSHGMPIYGSFPHNETTKALWDAMAERINAIAGTERELPDDGRVTHVPTAWPADAEQNDHGDASAERLQASLVNASKTISRLCRERNEAVAARDAAMDRTSLIEKERNAAWKERDKAHARIAELDAKVRKQHGDMIRIAEIADQPPF